MPESAFPCGGDCVRSTWCRLLQWPWAKACGRPEDLQSRDGKHERTRRRVHTCRPKKTCGRSLVRLAERSALRRIRGDRKRLCGRTGSSPRALLAQGLETSDG